MVSSSKLASDLVCNMALGMLIWSGLVTTLKVLTLVQIPPFPPSLFSLLTSNPPLNRSVLHFLHLAIPLLSCALLTPFSSSLCTLLVYFFLSPWIGPTFLCFFTNAIICPFALFVIAVSPSSPPPPRSLSLSISPSFSSPASSQFLIKKNVCIHAYD